NESLRKEPTRMGSLTSAIAGIAPAVGAVSNVVKTASKAIDAVKGLSDEQNKKAEADLELRQLQQKQQLEEAQAEQTAALQQQHLDAQPQAAAENRRQALLSAVAKQRAAYGAEGIDAGSGSPQAVLLGLYNDSDAQAAQADQIAQLKDQATQLGLDQ